MPTVRIHGVGEVDFPDSMAPRDIEAAIKRDIEPIITQRRQAMQTDMERMADPLAGTTPSYRAVAGYGKAIPDILRGLGQTVGLVSREDVAEARKRDEPLMRSKEGMAGNIAGNIAALVPTAAIPGVTTVRGAAALGAGLGATAPSASTEETVGNVALGGLLGGGSQAVAGRVARSFQSGARASPRERIAAEGAEAGLVVPPSQREGAGVVSRGLEGFAGKLTTAQAASSKNAEQVNALARRALGVADDVELTPQTLEKVRYKAAEPYRRIAAFGKTEAKMLEDLKEARFQQNLHFKHYAQTGDPRSYAAAKGFQATAAGIEDAFDNLAKVSGLTELPRQLKEARKLIAKAHDVERATNVATGNVEAPLLGKMLDKGKPLTGELRQIAEFAESFPKAVQPIERMGSLPGISPLDIAASGILGGAGALTTQQPEGAAAALIPFLRPAVRAGLLSRTYQKAVGAPGLLSRLPGARGNEALIEDVLRRSAVPLSLSVPAVTQ